MARPVSLCVVAFEVQWEGRDEGCLECLLPFLGYCCAYRLPNQHHNHLTLTATPNTQHNTTHHTTPHHRLNKDRRKERYREEGQAAKRAAAGGGRGGRGGGRGAKRARHE